MCSIHAWTIFTQFHILQSLTGRLGYGAPCSSCSATWLLHLPPSAVSIRSTEGASCFPGPPTESVTSAFRTMSFDPLSGHIRSHPRLYVHMLGIILCHVERVTWISAHPAVTALTCVLMRGCTSSTVSCAACDVCQTPCGRPALPPRPEPAKGKSTLHFCAEYIYTSIYTRE